MGKGLFDFGYRDGKGKLAMLQHHLGAHFSKGKIYIGDSYNHKIKVLDLKTTNITTVELVVDGIKSLWVPAGVLEFNSRFYV